MKNRPDEQVVETFGNTELVKSPIGFLWMRCKRCGYEIQKEWIFCPRCGQELGADADGEL